MCARVCVRVHAFLCVRTCYSIIYTDIDVQNSGCDETETFCSSPWVSHDSQCWVYLSDAETLTTAADGCTDTHLIVLFIPTHQRSYFDDITHYSRARALIPLFCPTSNDASVSSL